MNGYRSRQRVFLLAAVAAVLALQFMYVTNLASGAPKKVAERKTHAADSRELVAAGNQLKVTQKAGTAKGAKLAFTGGPVAPTVSIALMIMLDGALMILFARPKERLL